MPRGSFRRFYRSGYGKAEQPHGERILKTLKPGSILLADKAYDTDVLRAFADEKQSCTNIPPKRNRKKTFAFSSWCYRQRNLRTLLQ